MKTAAAYIRVSTDDQIEYSPESQIKTIREYAKRNGYILPEEYIFMDEGISGRSTKHRTEFLRMIGIAKTKPKPFDTILLWKFSRFARNREDSIVYKSMLRKQCGIDVVSITESIGDDKMSVLIEAMIEAMDEYYSINLAEEVRRGMTEKARRGEFQTVAPFGYFLKDKKLHPKEGEAEIIQKVFSDYLAGKGIRSIANELNALGIRTHRGGLIEYRTISYWLRNPVYAGMCRWTTSGKRARDDFDNPDTLIVKSSHIPIISESVFNAAQEKAIKTKQCFAKYSKPREDISSWLCGIVRCEICGGVLSNCGGYLVCSNRNRGTCQGCGSIKTSKLEQITINYLSSALSDDNVDFTFSATNNTPSIQSFSYDNLLAAAQLKLQRIRDAYIRGIDTIEEYEANRAAINKEIEELEKQQSSSQKSETVSPDISKLKKQIKKTLNDLQNKTLSNGEKNASLRTIFKEINKNQKSLSFIFHR